MSEKSISVSQYFECPSCKQDRIEEIRTGVTVSTPISDLYIIDTTGSTVLPVAVNVEVDYGILDEMEQTLEDGGVDRYQCVNCGWVIFDEDSGTVTAPDDLLEWLEEHKENREKLLNTP